MNKVHNLFTYMLFLSLFFSACEKDEDNLVFDEKNLKPSVLTFNSSILTLKADDNSKEAIKLSWTKSDFGYPAVISYKIQFGRKGTNFQKPSEIEAGTALERSITVKDLNKALTTAGAIANSVNRIEIRIVGYISPTAKIYSISNVSDFDATPYFQFRELPVLYVPGGYQGWLPDKAETIASIDKSLEGYEGYFNFSDTKNEFKITPEPDWDEDWGDATDGTSGDMKPKGANMIINGAGYYLIKANTKTLKWSAIKTSWGVVGDATSAGWNTDTDMVYDNTTKTWSVTLNLSGGKFIKFRANGNDTINFGDGTKNTPSTDGFCDYDGDKILIPEDGNYTVSLNLSNAGNYYYGLKKN
jgi:starch-binding outer membrane protein SusE/F